MNSPLARAFSAVMEGFSLLYGLGMGAMIAMMSLDVLLRGFSLGSLPWVTELTEYFMYAGTFLAAPWVLRQGGHVRVDMLLISVSRPVAARLEQLIDAIGFLIALVLLAYGSLAVHDAFRDHMIQFKTWDVPEWLLLLAIPISGALLAIEFVLRFLRVPGVVSETYNITDRPSI